MYMVCVLGRFLLKSINFSFLSDYSTPLCTGPITFRKFLWCVKPGDQRLPVTSACVTCHSPIDRQGRRRPETKAAMELKELLAKLVRREHLNDEEATFAIQLIASEASTENPVGVGVLLALLAAKGETGTEVTAFARYMRKQSIHVVVEVRCRRWLYSSQLLI